MRHDLTSYVPLIALVALLGGFVGSEMYDCWRRKR